MIRQQDTNLKQHLEKVDWGFTERHKPHKIESIHPYPAKFIGDLPRTLMQLIPCPKGTLVLDPFAGSGTTLMESQRMGLPSVGIDLNPIACLISRVKTQNTPRNLVAIAKDIKTNAQHCGSHERVIPNLDHWFKKDVQTSVAGLVAEIEKVDDLITSDALKLALSSILVRVSNQESDTRYAAIEKKISGIDVFNQYLKAVEKLDTVLKDRAWALHPSKIIEGNTLDISAEQLGGKVGLVITSPPYPNAYEYWLYHKYRMWWLGFDPISVKKQEIGARAHFFKKEPHTEENFWQQMRGTFNLISEALVTNGHVCFIVGRSKIHGKIIDNADIIQTVAEEIGFTTVIRTERVISATRKSFNLSHANIKTETVLVLRKN